MISITNILNKISLNESIQVIKHLEHHGEKLYTGNPDATIKHLRATANFLAGTPEVGHNLSYKVDGSVSIVFGKHGGRPFVKYKGEGSPHLYSQKEVDEATKEKPYLKAPFTVGLKAANHPSIGEHTGYQADIALESAPTTFKGNLITYMKPDNKKKHAIAVHTQLNTDTGEKTGSNPDVSFLETKEAHFPHLSLNRKSFDMKSDELEQLRHHISMSETLLKDPKVANLASNIASHVDPTNKTGHRHLIFKQFTNAVQRGEVQERSVENLKTWLEGKIEKTKGSADKARMQGHLSFISQHPIALQNLLKAHDHADLARDIIVDVLHRNENLPMTPEGGHSQGEGFVSELPGHGQVKFIPQTFTSANVAQKEKFKKAAKDIKEEMAVGGGGVAGIGINTSTGEPNKDEVKVSKAAQYNYTQANMGMQPLYGNTPRMNPNPKRRRFIMNMLKHMNVGKEAY
jgi:hypothetical protein